MGTATTATTGFEREAEQLLREHGYECDRRSGKNHMMFRHAKDPSRAIIRVPSTPKNPSASLVFIRHAINKGTATHVPQGMETDVMAPKTTTEQPMSEKLVALASSYMLAKAKDKRERRERGDTSKRPPDRRYPTEIGKWMRRAIEAYGCLDSGAINEAAKVLELDANQLSQARTDCGAAAYRMPGTGSAQVSRTDFVKRIPEGAQLAGGRVPAGKVKHPVKRTFVAPAAPPNGNEGRRLEQGGLTDDEHAEAEQRMVAGHRAAEAERLEILARRGESMQTVRGETNGNGKMSELEAAMAMVREAALAETHALTLDDMRALSGMRETMRRHAEEATSAAGMITRLLERVAPAEVHA